MKNKATDHRGLGRKWLLMIPAGLLAAAVLIYRGNHVLGVTDVTVADDRIPAAFDGFTIAQISDLHCAEFGEGNSALLDALRRASPDIIAVTGDLVDHDRADIDVGIDFIREAAKLAPVYFVTGNHEAARKDFSDVELRLTLAGATVLRCENRDIEVAGEHMTIAGMDDRGLLAATNAKTLDTAVAAGLKEALGDSGNYTVLLAHRPELLEKYAAAGADLVLCGHAHGGLVRLPFVGGLVAPGQGLFPRYDSGLYTLGGTNMVVSRGLGNSGSFFRVNDPPELVIVTLTAN